MENKPELLTIKKTALVIGVQYRQLLEAVNLGTVPHYQIEKSRKLLNPAEVIAIMKNDGGCNE
jgi:hypothetical protein